MRTALATIAAGATLAAGTVAVAAPTAGRLLARPSLWEGVAQANGRGEPVSLRVCLAPAALAPLLREPPPEPPAAGCRLTVVRGSAGVTLTRSCAATADDGAASRTQTRLVLSPDLARLRIVAAADQRTADGTRGGHGLVLADVSWRGDCPAGMAPRSALEPPAATSGAPAAGR